jgi:hypothetical protein
MGRVLQRHYIAVISHDCFISYFHFTAQNPPSISHSRKYELRFGKRVVKKEIETNNSQGKFTYRV